MTTRFWLRTPLSLEEKVAGRADLLKDTRTRVDYENGKPYTPMDGDVMGPAPALPAIPTDLVKLITYIGKIQNGLRTDGIYRHKGAEARLTTVRQGVGNGDLTANVQTIAISAHSVRSLREIYSKIRSGELKPEEKWT